MRKALWTLLGLAVVAGFGGVWIWNSWANSGTIDLVELFDGAEKQSTMGLHQAFSVGDYSVGGDRRRAIFAHPTSQITWHVTVPDRARLDLALGISEEAWTKPGDGMRFRVDVRDGGTDKLLFERHLEPAVWVADRGWQPVSLDLSGFAGSTIDLILSTHASKTGEADPRYDWAMWGSPMITQPK
jgi:hypothetical protein